MYIHVKLFTGLKRQLTYAVPSDWEKASLRGSIVRVPLRQKTVLALVDEVVEALDPYPSYVIREALALEPFPRDQLYMSYIKRVAQYYQVDPIVLIKRMSDFLQVKRMRSIKHAEASERREAPVCLTPEQQKITEILCEKIRGGKFFPALLHGLTGSGKTEVYKYLIKQALELNQSALFLVPEVSLAVVLEQRLRSTFGAAVFGFHSATSQTVKRKLFDELMKGAPVIVIGVHLPVLLPFENLGLIIVDEEHDTGFQEKKHPKINSKEAALLRAHYYGITICLGSATPSLHSWHHVHAGTWHLFSLTQRFSGKLPHVRRVNLTDYGKRKSFWVSPPLESAIRQRLAAGEGIIIFLNRRGYSFFIQCASCGFVPQCTQCSVSLTMHEDTSLKCHYCAYVRPTLPHCPDCTSTEFIKKGIGTQQLVRILQGIFPEARVARADLDTTVNRVKWQKTLDDFHAGVIDILVGTQTLCKGHHFANVTLVGVLWADINLSMPRYNAAEVTLQQLIQVAGRAGRTSERSEVIIQSMNNHDIFNYLCEEQYPCFIEHELQSRRTLQYPPIVRLAEIEIRHNDEDTVIQEAEKLLQEFDHINKSQNLSVTLLGPTLPLIEKVKNTYSRLIYCKAAAISSLIRLYSSCDTSVYKSDIFLTHNPLN